MKPLPIDPLLSEVVAALRRQNRLVLRAAPGAGKTTRVPRALLEAGVAGDQRILVLEPRRLAARAAAEFVASELQQPIGEQVGYRVRYEQRGTPRTRLWFVTPGIFERQLASDPFLETTNIVVLDEFHERQSQCDAALTVIRELQDTLRPDLKLVVMSATLQTEQIAAYLGDCPVSTSEGREFPVAIEYVRETDGKPLSRRVADALESAIRADDDGGGVLVFLPGAAEIRRTAAELSPLTTAKGWDVVLLHGDLPLEAQRRAIEIGPRRKIVLATNVAETSLTIEGVTLVIDSGLAREVRVDAAHGINALRVVRISAAAAEQRAGRAGRVRPGRCLRLWSRAEHARRRPHTPPEILRLELSGTVLALRAWGARDVRTLRWLDPPPAAALEHAERLLFGLGAVDAAGGLTPTGEAMLRLAVAPRLARILHEARLRGVSGPGALIAALASERDIYAAARTFGPLDRVPWPAEPSDLLLRMRLFADAERQRFVGHACRNLGLDPSAVRAVDRARRHLQRGGALTGERAFADDEVLLRCIVAGFPDRIVRRRAPGSTRGVMVGGRGVELADDSVVREEALFAAVEVEAGRGRAPSEAHVRLASAVRREWLDELFPGSIRASRTLIFDADRERVVERRQELFGDLVLSEAISTDVDPVAAGPLLAEAARSDPARAVGLDDGCLQLLQRIEFLGRALPDEGLPPDSGPLLAEAVTALCIGRRGFDELRRADVAGTVRALLAGRQVAVLEREAPASYRLPTGRAVRIQYGTGKPPVVDARIQEVFGLMRTPRLAAGRIPLVFRLLAPNSRPVQITDDLENFWRSTYHEVRKILRGRYPKHAWPEDPLAARPTVGGRPQKG